MKCCVCEPHRTKGYWIQYSSPDGKKDPPTYVWLRAWKNCQQEATVVRVEEHPSGKLVYWECKEHANVIIRVLSDGSVARIPVVQ